MPQRPEPPVERFKIVSRSPLHDDPAGPQTGWWLTVESLWTHRPDKLRTHDGAVDLEDDCYAEGKIGTKGPRRTFVPE